jgi:putative superfamily III holin-X
MTQPGVTDDKPVGELFQELSAQTTTLVRKELQLAQLEMQAKGKRAGVGAGLFGGAGLVAFYGGGALIVTIGLALAEVVDGWLAGLIVTVLLFALAGVLALTGKKQVDQATPPAPEQAIETTKASIDTVKERAQR